VFSGIAKHMEYREIHVDPYKRNSGPVSGHKKLIPVKRNASKNKKAESPASLIVDKPTVVFPDPAYIPEQLTPFQRFKQNRKWAQRKEVVAPGLTHTTFTRNKIRKNGTGTLTIYTSFVGKTTSAAKLHGMKTDFHYGPNKTITNPAFTNNANYSHAELSDLNMQVKRVTECSFEGAKLPNSRLGIYSCMFSNVSFDGADLTGANFSQAIFFNVTFRGAKLTDTILNLGIHQKDFSVDITDSNITAKQFDNFFAKASRFYSPEKVKMRRHSFNEAIELTGHDRDTLLTMLWLGEIEYRSKENDQTTDDMFDPDEHYIPQWTMQEHLANKKSEN
jgi:hypothetical protein